MNLTFTGVRPDRMRYTVATQPESQDRPPIRLLQTKTGFFSFLWWGGWGEWVIGCGQAFRTCQAILPMHGAKCGARCFFVLFFLLGRRSESGWWRDEAGPSSRRRPRSSWSAE